MISLLILLSALFILANAETSTLSSREKAGLEHFGDGTVRPRVPMPFHKNPNVSSQEPLVLPATENQTATMIFLHGHGDDGYDWEDELQRIQEPYMKVIIPHADGFLCSWHNSINFTSWFDFRKRHYPQNDFDLDAMRGAAKYVHRLIDGEIEKGIKPEKIIVAGNSQGGLLAIHAGISFPKRLGGIVALTPWCPNNSSLLQESLNDVNKDIPLFHGQVSQNLYIKDCSAKKIAEQLKEYVSKNLFFKLYKGYIETTDEEFDDVQKFCRKHVGPGSV